MTGPGRKRAWFPLTILKKMDDNRERSGAKKKKTASACDVEALKKCLEQYKGDYNKCQSQIEAFKASCSLNKPSDSS
ncbi:hypothetical protein L1987_76020 [Smallanthus sonchifolius]|uniref:Uncharacterized protein n=1 Tax=Smallanthus sonchifolius TaxID=185202 RepID=A0ACB9A7C5_9ASTR|nr:hypothetical protein L1987_76020 [Smallanthus sonchifolius]